MRKIGYAEIHGHYAWGIDEFILNFQDAKNTLNESRNNEFLFSIKDTAYLVFDRR